MRCWTSLAWLMALPSLALAGEATELATFPLAWVCLGLFVLAYLVVMLEEVIDLHKSKPMLLGATAIWVVISLLNRELGIPAEHVHGILRAELVEYAELFLFLLASTTYINALDERNTFKALCAWLIRHRLGYRQLFWVIAVVTFFLSTVVNNLTCALVVGTVVLAVGKDNPRFIAASCLIAVIAANAGGAASPFGDITSLMVWQDHKLDFLQFFPLFFPTLANFLVPALGLHFAIPKGAPAFREQDAVALKPGAWTILALFFLTILLAVLYEQVFALPAYLGMMTGLACLMFHAYWRQKRLGQACDIFHQIREVEWDTLLFFFGVVFAVGGLRYLGYLTLASHFLYEGLGPTAANILVGFLSAVIDNIPLMLAVLHMDPAMDIHQWQLVTLTAGVGGSMLAVGSAAGVAMLGQARGFYTSLYHLRWSPLVALGYLASIGVHYWLNGV
ncbi:MAG: sodium:proton antiporter NhaD [Methylohalobius sp.]|nr:sodium:proton antiporter NhaD [Methylohalobius sp.]